MIQVRASTPKQLVPGLMGILGDAYKDVPAEHTTLFEALTSNRAYEEEVMQSGFGLAAVKAEGGNIAYDAGEELWTARYSHETVALGFIITEEAIDDNLYENYSKKASKSLGRSLAETKQIKAAAVFNNGFNSTYKGGDAQPLFATAHPTKAASIGNSISQDVAEASLESVVIALNKWTDDRGLLINAKPTSLHIPVESQFDVERILKSTLRPTVVTNGTTGVTNTNEVNALNSMGMFNSVNVHRRFTDTDAFFIKTDVPDSTKMFTRKKPQLQTDGDFQTGNTMIKLTERYSFGWSDWRGWYGSQGA